MCSKPKANTAHFVSFHFLLQAQYPGLLRSAYLLVSLPHRCPLVVRRQRAALMKAAIEKDLADVGRRTSVVTKPIAERSATGGVGRVGAFEVQVR